MGRDLSENARLAAAIIDAAIESGVGEWVIGAGARNLPLLDTLLRLPEKQRGRVWNFFEERSAAFFALGRARNSRHRVAVITTSGTAAAELLPATIEAHYSAVSLLMITADRPREFRGSGAPQAIEQKKLLSPYVWRSVDWVAEADKRRVADRGRRDRPEHWNVCLAEPESGDGEGEVAASAYRNQWTQDEIDDDLVGTLDAHQEVRWFCSNEEKEGPLVVLLGDLSVPESEVLEPALAKLGAPLWAESTSGLRESPLLRPLMPPGGERGIAALKPKRVLRIGGVPSLRFWRDLETLPDVAVLSITKTGFPGLARESAIVSGVDSVANLNFGAAVADFSRVHDSLDELLQRFPASEPAMVRALSERIDSEALVYLGNSLPIREWNLAATIDRPHAYCFANRGANGIDGQVSTFLGLTAAAGDIDSGAWGIFGDLTALYDLSAPWIIPQLASGTKRRMVVINNGGGRIFDRLPAVVQGGDQQRRLVCNEHRHDFRHWAAMWNMGYALWSADDDWREPEGEAVVIEIKPSADQTRAFWDAWDNANSDES